MRVTQRPSFVQLLMLFYVLSLIVWLIAGADADQLTRALAYLVPALFVGWMIVMIGFWKEAGRTKGELIMIMDAREISSL